MLNSAEFYGADRINERIIAQHAGPAFQISLKIGIIGDLNKFQFEMNSSAVHLRPTVDESLKILGRESLDLIIQARQDPATPIEDVMKTFKELVDAGVCRRFSALSARLHALTCTNICSPALGHGSSCCSDLVQDFYFTMAL
jgi:aryl-alcohol dehydrogenase-like predicted oxidoreductase